MPASVTPRCLVFTYLQHVYCVGRKMATAGGEIVANDGEVVQDGGNQQNANQVYFQ